MQTVLIVNPPARSGVYGQLTNLAAVEIPVWAGIIANYLRHHDYQVEVLDAEVEGLSEVQTAKRIRSARPDLAVFTIYGQQPSASTQCLPAAEGVVRDAGVRSIALGTHPSALPLKTLREGPWTYVAQGEGHRTVRGLLQVLDGMHGLEGVEGLWRWVDNKVVGPKVSPMNSIDLDAELGGRGFSFFDFDQYRAHNWHAFGYPSRSPYASLQTSLGCPFACTFCCINAPFGGTGIRFWSPGNVSKHFYQLGLRGVTHVKIPDEMFLLNPRHVEAICDALIDLRGDFNIWAYARVDTCRNERLLEKMKRAGFNWLGIGIESGSEHVRDGVAKGAFGQLEIVTAVKKVQAQGIAVGANYIFGLPDDTIETMQGTLELACELNTEWANFYCAMAYPGSQLHKDAQGRGWRLPEDPGGPGWIGYSQHNYETLPLPTEHLSAAEVLRFRDAAFHYYFDRPEYFSMLERKFGEAAVQQVQDMLAKGPIRRRLIR